MPVKTQAVKRRPADHKRRIKKAAAAAFSLALMLMLIIIPGPALSGARVGLTLCGETVIPSLFPFLVISSFVINSGLAASFARFFEPFTRKVFRLPGASGMALILGAVGGYPVGADAVANLCEGGSIEKSEAERLLCFAINSSPAFIIGAVGAGFLGSSKAGMLLLASHLSASLAIGLILRGKPDRRAPRPAPPRKSSSCGYPAAFVGAVTGSARGIIVISAFVVLFSSLNSLLNYTGVTGGIAEILARFLPVPLSDGQFYRRMLTGVLEVTNGCAAASGAGGMTAVLLTAGMLGFSGVSVQFQVMSMVRGAGLSTKLFIMTRFLNVVLSVLFAWALFSIFPDALPPLKSVQAFAFNPDGLSSSFHSVPAVCAMLFICAMLLLSLVHI